MHKILIGTNWKMYKSIAEAKEYTTALKAFFENFSTDIELFIIPSFTSLHPVQEIVKDSTILLGAQNMHWQDEGAYTGEISPVHLKEIGVQIIELGHSERREYFNETDEILYKKVKAALKHGLKPLICIGETREEKELFLTKEVLATQLKTIFQKIEVHDAQQLWIAYEPRWAIGEGGKVAEPKYIEEVHECLRDLLIEILGEVGKTVPILFGGSVNSKNAIPYLKCKHVSGLFIGRAAWDLDSFKDILLQVKKFVEHRKKVRSCS
ncbi:triose-phosphate isomerase [Psychrobacillus sp. INOP01]|uniref:triose-phosphate isomerase n=1 Tax=Psychrobacillus sp. INOP01 TaxID=2829187 RepID=UPI001BA5DA02|nr:triose-phosphate isomerase [Psychrobacillus sp. INOP01]QUG42596.1 triose-phosphate isomerase [Psychrobacillus sp. INOP01]